MNGSREDAETTLTAMCAVHSEQRPQGETAWDFVLRWLRDKSGITDYTRRGYEGTGQQYLEPSLRFIPLRVIGKPDVVRLLRSLEDRNLSERTIQISFGLLSQALTYAVEMGLLSVNPCWLVDAPTRTRSEPVSLSAGEVSRILATTKASRFYPLWALMLSTGLRPQEVFALRRADLDLDGERVTVVNVIEGFGCARYSMKAARDPRTIAIPLDVALTLRNYLATHDDPKAVFQYAPATVRGAWNKTPSEDKRVFPQSAEAVRGAWRRALVAAKVPPMALFSTRHTHTNQLIMAGVHPSMVGERTGVTPQHVLDGHEKAVPELSTASSVAVAARLFDLAETG